MPGTPALPNSAFDPRTPLGFKRPNATVTPCGQGYLRSPCACGPPAATRRSHENVAFGPLLFRPSHRTTTAGSVVSLQKTVLLCELNLASAHSSGSAKPICARSSGVNTGRMLLTAKGSHAASMPEPPRHVPRCTSRLTLTLNRTMYGVSDVIDSADVQAVTRDRQYSRRMARCVAEPTQDLSFTLLIPVTRSSDIRPRPAFVRLVSPSIGAFDFLFIALHLVLRGAAE